MGGGNLVGDALPPYALKRMEKTGYSWFEGEVVEEGNADDTDDNDGGDYEDMEDIIDNVLGIDDDEADDGYDAVADNDINSKNSDGGNVDSDNEEEEFFPVFEEEEGATVTTKE